MYSFTRGMTGRGQIFVYKLYTFFVGCNALVLPLQHFTFISNQIVLTTMKRMLNRMLRYADAIVKRGVDKLIDTIAHNPEPQTINAENQAPNATSNGGDASLVGKIYSYYLVEFVFPSFLYPAGRVAPISVCVFCSAFQVNSILTCCLHLFHSLELETVKLHDDKMKLRALAQGLNTGCLGVTMNLGYCIVPLLLRMLFGRALVQDLEFENVAMLRGIMREVGQKEKVAKTMVEL